MLLRIPMHLFWFATHMIFHLIFLLFISYSQSLYATLHDTIIFLSLDLLSNHHHQKYTFSVRNHMKVWCTFSSASFLCSIDDFFYSVFVQQFAWNGVKILFLAFIRFFWMFFRRPSPIVFLFSVLWLISVHTDVYTHSLSIQLSFANINFLLFALQLTLYVVQVSCCRFHIQ